ncbi:MAG: hypothetical protein ACW99G_01040 [Candidatus Thorarchaeota archaeon]|jgi:hypothetical protein
MQSELDLGSLIIGNLVFSFYMTPMVLIGASVFRGLLLLSGQKREFEDWTRNKLMTILSIIFLPGSLAFIGIRLLIVRIFRVTIEDIGSSSTYGEINVFLKVDKPPRVGIVLTVLFLNVVAAVFVAFLLILLPVMVVVEPLWFAVLIWISAGILFNCSIRSGDFSLLVASIRNRPKSGVIELVTFIVVLGFIYYIRIAGVGA